MLVVYIAFIALFLSTANFDRSKIEPAFGVVQFDANGIVVRTEKVTSFQVNSSCVLFHTPEYTVPQALCGSLYVGMLSGLDVPGTPSEKARYAVVQYDADMHVLRTWYATTYWTKRGSIGFKTEAMPGVEQYVTGIVSASPIKP